MTLNLDNLRVGGDGQVWIWTEHGQRTIASGKAVHELDLPAELPYPWQLIVWRSEYMAEHIKVVPRSSSYARVSRQTGVVSVPD